MTNQSFPNLASITSESLQLKIRQLLPSQAGFGSDLMAQNVIVPIVDLTASAEGSDVRADLQSALAWGSQSSFVTSTGDTTLASTSGFYRILGNVAFLSNPGGATEARIFLENGTTEKNIYRFKANVTAADVTFDTFDFTVFLNLNDSIKMNSDTTAIQLAVTVRQIADNNGTLIPPSGFDPQ